MDLTDFQYMTKTQQIARYSIIGNFHILRFFFLLFYSRTSFSLCFFFLSSYFIPSLLIFAKAHFLHPSILDEMNGIISSYGQSYLWNVFMVDMNWYGRRVFAGLVRFVKRKRCHFDRSSAYDEYEYNENIDDDDDDDNDEKDKAKRSASIFRNTDSGFCCWWDYNTRITYTLMMESNLQAFLHFQFK